MKFSTINPATEEVLQAYETMPTEKVVEVARQSKIAFQAWKKLTISQRAAFFTSLAKELRDGKKEYATLMSKEMGKVITESRGEVEKCAWLAEVLVEKAGEWLGPEKVPADGVENIIEFTPLGPILIIMPWNYPFWQVFKVALPPLIAGNTIILKHARNVTGSALLIQEIFKKAGFPQQVFQTVVVDHDGSAALISHPDVAACSLTGSVGAGSKIAAQAGAEIKKVVLELGGADPHIVLDDVDIEVAARGAVLGRTSNVGQVCIGSKRILVPRKIAKPFAQRFAELMAQRVVGNPLDEKTQIGPLASKSAVQEMEAFVHDAVQKGATVLTGGKRRPGKGYFFEPTVLFNVSKDMNVVCQEVFGPIAPVIVFDSDEEAIAIANDSEYGLSASIWTKDIPRAKKMAEQLEVGGVFINSVSNSHPLMPLGGVKKSGFGRELSKFGILEFVNIKPINVYKHK